MAKRLFTIVIAILLTVFFASQCNATSKRMKQGTEVVHVGERPD